MVSLVRRAIGSLPRRQYPGELTKTLGWESSWLGGLARSGAEVSTDTALQVSSVYACVRLISSSIAALPLHTYRKTSSGRERVTLASERVVWGSPNPEVSRVHFWETAISHAVLTGNSFIYVARDPSGRAAELWPVEPNRVQVGRDPGGRKTFLVDGTIPQTEYRAGGNILHVPGYSFDGLVGLSTLAYARQAIGISLTAERTSSALFRNGSQPNGLLSTEQRLTAEQAKAISEGWEALHAGADNAGKVAVLGAGVKWQTTSLNPDDAQMLETRRFEVNEIARWFGVPVEMIGGAPESAGTLTYSNLEDRIQSFVTLALQPWIARFEQTVTDQLLAPSSHYAKFDLRGLLRGNSVSRVAYYRDMVGLGAMTVDEVRELEDFEPLPAA